MCSNCSGDYENPDETNEPNEPIEPPPCQHEHRRINLSTAWLECLDCNEPLLDLDPWLSQSLRIARNL